MSLSKLSREHIRPLLVLNDELRDLASLEHDINLTCIVAVGDQSHGKTSVIEALSGINLPRGGGIQTRAPLVLCIKNLEESHVDQTEEFATIKAKGAPMKEIKLSDTSAMVKEYTEIIAGTDSSGMKNIVDTEIHLTVYRRGQDDLTLIDLPGMTRVPTHGQPDNIEETITRMYERYMKPEEAILLNVVSAMVDFETSKSLSMSRKFDAKGKRTLLCITKIDQFTDHGLVKKVENAHTQMHLPAEYIFCVRNRSQLDTEKGLTLENARQIETNFIQQHSELSHLPPGTKGVNSMTSRLIQLQYDRIRETLPIAARSIRKRIKQLGDELAALGNPLDDEMECRDIIQKRLQAMQKSLADNLNGRVTTSFGPRSVLADSALASARIQSSHQLFSCDEGSVIDVKLQNYRNNSATTSNNEVFYVNGPHLRTTIGDFNLRFAPSKGGLFICIENVPMHIQSINCDTYLRAYDKTEEREVRAHDLEYNFTKAKDWIGCGFNNFVSPITTSTGNTAATDLSQNGRFSFDASITINSIEYESQYMNDNDQGLLAATNVPSSVTTTTSRDILSSSVAPSPSSSKISSGAKPTHGRFMKHKNAPQRMFCATIHSLDKEFSSKVHGMYPDYHFFTDAFANLLQKEMTARQTSSIFQDQTETGMAVLHKLRVTLVPELNSYIDSMAHEVREFLAHNVHESFAEFPNLLVIAQDTIEQLMEKQEKLTEQLVQDYVNLEEKSTHTQSLYYKQIVTTLYSLLMVKPEEEVKPHIASVAPAGKKNVKKSPQQEPAATPPQSPIMRLSIPAEYEFLRPKIQKIRTLQQKSSDKQRILNLQIELYAYWKVMSLRVNDYIEMVARHHLIRDPFEDLIIWELQKNVLDQRGKLVPLMAFDESRLRQIELKKTRLERLQKAQNSLIRAHSKRLELEEMTIIE